MNKKLANIAPFLVPMAMVGGGFIIVFLIALIGRIFTSRRRRPLMGRMAYTPQYTSNWPPSVTPRPYIPPPMPTHQVGDARDAIIEVSNGAPFSRSLDGRGECLLLPPPAATQPEKQRGSMLGDQKPSTSAIHMDAAER